MTVGGTTYLMVRILHKRLDTCRFARVRVGGRCFCFLVSRNARVRENGFCAMPPNHNCPCKSG